MKRILLIALLLVPTISSADAIDRYTEVLTKGAYSEKDILTPSESIDLELKESNCSAVSKFAESSFKARQRGASAEQMYSVIETDSAEVKRLLRSVVADTFAYPIAYSGKQLDSAASEYGSQFYIECMQ